MKEDGQSAYNSDYQHDKFALPWRQYDWSVLYVNALLYLEKTDVIMEFGCGCGQFAQMMQEFGYNYSGFDFSDVAIDRAVKLTGGNGHVFWEDIYNVTNNLKYFNFNTVVSFEVFEHIQDTVVLSRLSKYKPGVKIVASVPSQPARGHLRTFDTIREVRTYYKEFIDLKVIRKIDQWFLFTGNIRSI